MERKLLEDVVKHQLTRAQQRMKSQADKHRQEKEFAVGDMVYLRLQPYIQSSVAPRRNQKLSYHFYGPFRILARVGQVAYRLDLPADCLIHSVVHASQVKRHVPSPKLLEDDISTVPLGP